MYVLKRNGSQEPMLFDKIRVRIRELSQSLDVDPALIIKDVISGLISGITTSEIDTLTCEAAYARSTHSPDYDTLAGRIYVSNLHKSTAGGYKDLIDVLQANTTSEDEPLPLLDPEMVKFALKYVKEIDSAMNYSRDYDLTYFALKTLEKSYLLKNSKTKQIYERPQQMYMRMAVGLHYPREDEYKNYARKYASVEELEQDALNRALATYDALSRKKISHASPAMFNLGTKYPQGSSCFLFNVGDSLDKIYETLHRCAMASKFAGGLGVNVSNVRCRASLIKSTNGGSSGIIPMLQVFAKTAKYVDQGNKRNGAMAVYIEPWHGPPGLHPCRFFRGCGKAAPVGRLDDVDKKTYGMGYDRHGSIHGQPSPVMAVREADSLFGYRHSSRNPSGLDRQGRTIQTAIRDYKKDYRHADHSAGDRLFLFCEFIRRRHCMDTV